MSALSKQEWKTKIKEESLKESNKYCADCAAYGTQWASTNLGIYLCLDCAGAHRSLGSHISKIRSITLDAWDEHLVSLMCQKGNDQNDYPKPPHTKDTFDHAESRAAYIRKRYVASKDAIALSDDLFEVTLTKINQRFVNYKGFIHGSQLTTGASPSKLSFSQKKHSPEKDRFRKNHMVFYNASCFSLPSHLQTGVELNAFFKNSTDSTMLLRHVEPFGPSSQVLFYDPDSIVFIDTSGLLKAYSLYECKISMHILIQASLIAKVHDDCLAICHDHTLAIHNFVDHNRFLVQLDIPSLYDPVHAICSLKNEKAILFCMGNDTYKFDWEEKLKDTEYRKSKASLSTLSSFSRMWSSIQKSVSSTLESYAKIPFCRLLLSNQRVVQMESLHDDRFMLATSSGDIRLYTNDGMFLYHVGNHPHLIRFGLLGRYTLFSYSNQELYLWDYVHTGNVNKMDNLTEQGLHSIVDVVALSSTTLLVIRSDDQVIHIQCNHHHDDE